MSSLLCRTTVSRRAYTVASSSRQPTSPWKMTPYSPPTGTTAMRSLASVGGQSVSEPLASHSPRTTARKGPKEKKINSSTWSPWEVAAISLLAGATSFGLIAYPRAVQNEPMETAATPSLQHHFTFVQRNPNRMHMLEQQQQYDASKRVEMQTSHQVTSDGKAYDVSGWIFGNSAMICDFQKFDSDIVVLLYSLDFGTRRQGEPGHHGR